MKTGADILILNEISKFLLNNITSLTRFSKSKIGIIDLAEVRKKNINKEQLEIIAASMRLDAILSEILRTSRKKAEEYIDSGRIFVNHEDMYKSTKQLKEKDVLTIRGKGRFEIDSISGETRSGRIKIKVNKYI